MLSPPIVLSNSATDYNSPRGWRQEGKVKKDDKNAAGSSFVPETGARTADSIILAGWLFDSLR